MSEYRLCKSRFQTMLTQLPSVTVVTAVVSELD